MCPARPIVIGLTCVVVACAWAFTLGLKAFLERPSSEQATTATINAMSVAYSAPAKILIDDPEWNDPSVDPAVVERAFARVSKPLPPESVAWVSDIMPSEDAMQEMQVNDVISY